ncbi:3-isopropylmalate dehydratase small subunit [uncultured Roseibium sp.]|uniref:3-isopropylmalate dehydratase small subunit n=1 Tax=uncultured Roseibium sp. TaxID=1936171 RepID=UPI0026334FB8|nr:3-isopropylmalate dehydratase small subunit [uncultured Roseibium sp.]
MTFGWTQHEGHAIALPAHNVDTDQLIPSRFMSTPRDEGYGKFLLHDLRRDADGNEHKHFPLNRFRNASILVTGRNFGSGSSREAAVYALVDAGIRAVLAPSFGDIFSSNAINNGMLPAQISPEDHITLLSLLDDTSMLAQICLEKNHISIGDCSIAFELDPTWRTKLINGWDDIDLTMQHGEDIKKHKKNLEQSAPWALPAANRQRS